MQTQLPYAFDRATQQYNRSIFSCLNCFETQKEAYSEIKHDQYAPELRKSRQAKISLKNAGIPNDILVPFESELTIGKSNTKLNQLRASKKSVRICNKIDNLASEESFPINKTFIEVSSQNTINCSMPSKSMSLRETNESIFQFSSTAKPKINFIYKHQQNHAQAAKSNSIILEQSLPPLPVLQMKPMISQVRVDISPFSSDIQVSKNGDQKIDNVSSSSQTSLTSPLNKLYKTAQKEILVSLEFKKKSNTSFENSQKLKIRRLPSHNEPFSKAAMKVRQTVSIKQPEQESDMVSVVITNSLINSFTGLLLPIDQNEMETRLSQYKE